MKYIVKTFEPTTSSSNAASGINSSVENIISSAYADGYEFVSMSPIETTVNDNGCFGFGAKSTQRVFVVLVFRK